jgi:hypothetical protein
MMNKNKMELQIELTKLLCDYLNDVILSEDITEDILLLLKEKILGD